MRRYFATHRLVDALAEDESGAVLKLTLNSAGKEKTVLIPREVELTPAPTGANGDDSATNDDSGLANFKATLLPNPNGSGMLGYLRIDAFAGTQSAYLLDQAMTRLNGTQGLILDLRKNGGGNMSGDAVLAHLAKAQTSLVRYTTSERMDNFILSQRPENFFLQWTQGTDFADWHDLTVDGSGEYFGKPVVALTSPNCFSACDTFSAGLKANGLATMIGEGTGGGTGTPLVFTLPSSGMQFRYGVVRGRTAKGDTIEGAGTLPDIVSEPTVADFVKNEDSQLNLALSVLISKITGKPPVPTTGPIPALAGMTPIHQQSLDVSPTRSAENDLERILKVDELAP
jgi:C-terminal processing protease CtpA/Prc